MSAPLSAVAGLLPWLAFACAGGAVAATAAGIWQAARAARMVARTDGTGLASPPERPGPEASRSSVARGGTEGVVWNRLAARLWWGAAALTMLAFGYLLSRFLAGDLSLSYVFFYTRTDLDWPWRVAGTWAGREGSLLLWTLYLAFVTVWFSQRRAGVGEAEGLAWSRLFLGVATMAFLGAVALQDTFAPTSSSLLQGRPLGNGLNPTLKSAFILIHPPLMFLAYALTTVPAAAALGHLASGTGRWSQIATGASRACWLLFTAAIGLGSLWAYYTLGFGGYWAWDPVEVANLLPWLALTVYLHAQLQHARHGTFAALGPMLALTPFLLTLFSTISTRSGLWVSVHAFTDPTDTFNPDAAARFMAILSVEPGLRFYLGCGLAVLFGGLAMWARRVAPEAPGWRIAGRITAFALATVAGLAVVEPRGTLGLLLDLGSLVGSPGYGLLALVAVATAAAGLPLLLASAPRPNDAVRRSWFRVDLASLAGFAVLALGLALLVLFLFHMAAVNGWSTAFYEARFPYLAAPVIGGLLVLEGLAVFGRRGAIGVAFATLGVAALAAWAFSAHRALAMLGIPAAVLVAVGLERVRRAASVGAPRARAGAALLVLAALVDLLFWVNPPSTVGAASWTWHPGWIAQGSGTAISLAVLGLALRILVGAPVRWPAASFAAAGIVGGFWLAPGLALVGWLLWRRARLEATPLHAKARARLRQCGIYGVHVALAIALLGYAPSTYLKQKSAAELAPGIPAEAAGFTLVLDGGAATGDSSAGVPGPATRLRPVLQVEEGGADGGAGGLGGSRAGWRGGWTGAPARGTVVAVLDWEEQAQTHYPRPAAFRTWSGDLYLNVDALHVSGGGCGSPPAWYSAYAATAARPCADGTIDGARITVVHLPGLGLLWFALVLLLGSMAVMMGQPGPAPPRSDPSPRPSPDGPPL